MCLRASVTSTLTNKGGWENLERHNHQISCIKNQLHNNANLCLRAARTKKKKSRIIKLAETLYIYIPVENLEDNGRNLLFVKNRMR